MGGPLRHSSRGRGLLTTLRESAVAAAETFRTFQDGQPDLVNIGLKAIQKHIGGMFGGNIVTIGAPQNTGKTSLLLEMLASSTTPGGVISLEDAADVWGARAIAKWSDVPPTAIRKKELSDFQLEDIRLALKTIPEDKHVVYALGATLPTIVEKVEELRKKGCRWIALDYLQKVRGHHNERRCEVAATMTEFQRACSVDIPGVAGAAVPVIMSQIVRLPPGTEPFPHHLKESGDIENESRMIILCWRDAGDPLTLRLKVSKSSFGGGGLTFSYKYTPAEYLELSEKDKEKW